MKLRPCMTFPHCFASCLATTPKTLHRAATCDMSSAASQGIQGKAPSVAAQVQNCPALCQVAHSQPAVSLVCIEARLLASACRHPKSHPILFYLCHNVQGSHYLDSACHTESCCTMTVLVYEARFATCTLPYSRMCANARSLLCTRFSLPSQLELQVWTRCRLQRGRPSMLT